jgi:hypothetical protein
LQVDDAQVAFYDGRPEIDEPVARKTDVDAAIETIAASLASDRYIGGASNTKPKGSPQPEVGAANR